MTLRFKDYIDFVKQLEAKRMDKFDRVILYLVRSCIIKTWLTEPDTTLFHINNKQIATVRERTRVRSKVYKYVKPPRQDVIECLEYMPDLGLFNSCQSDGTGVYFVLKEELFKFLSEEYKIFKTVSKPLNREVMPLSLIKVLIYFLDLSIIQNNSADKNQDIFSLPMKAHTNIGLDLNIFNSRIDELASSEIISIDNIIVHEDKKKLLEENLFYYPEYKLRFINQLL